MNKSRLSMSILSVVLLGLSSCASRGVDCEQVMCDLSRKTYVDKDVGYTLRYHPDDWYFTANGNSTVSLYSRFVNPTIHATFWSNSEEKNLSEEVWDERFRDVVDSVIKGSEIKANQVITINDVEFLVQEAESKSKEDYQKIYQLVSSTDRGSVAILITGSKNMEAKYGEEVDLLLQGFSMDGEACKGPSGLRRAKSVFDNLCDRGIINAS